MAADPDCWTAQTCATSMSRCIRIPVPAVPTNRFCHENRALAAHRRSRGLSAATGTAMGLGQPVLCVRRRLTRLARPRTARRDTPATQRCPAGRAADRSWLGPMPPPQAAAPSRNTAARRPPQAAAPLPACMARGRGQGPAADQQHDGHALLCGSAITGDGGGHVPRSARCAERKGRSDVRHPGLQIPDHL